MMTTSKGWRPAIERPGSSPDCGLGWSTGNLSDAKGAAKGQAGASSVQLLVHTTMVPHWADSFEPPYFMGVLATE